MLYSPHPHASGFHCDIARIARDASVAKCQSMSDELDALPDFPGKNLFTHREGQVLALLVQGNCHKSIARLLDINHRTVEGYVEVCIMKLRDRGVLTIGPNKNRAVVLTRHVYMQHRSP